MLRAVDRILQRPLCFLMFWLQVGYAPTCTCGRRGRGWRFYGTHLARYVLPRLRAMCAHDIVGKDYSNPRVNDFHALNKPFEDMYDRSKVPRMPWSVMCTVIVVQGAHENARHDVSMQMMGQPARDIARHFVQRFATVSKVPAQVTDSRCRWNWLLRMKVCRFGLAYITPSHCFHRITRV
jgi:hypothetical protein